MTDLKEAPGGFQDQFEAPDTDRQLRSFRTLRNKFLSGEPIEVTVGGEAQQIMPDDYHQGLYEHQLRHEAAGLLSPEEPRISEPLEVE